MSMDQELLRELIARDVAPIGMADLVSATNSLQECVQDWLVPSLLTGVMGATGCGSSAGPDLMRCLRLLASIWRHEGLRTVLSPHHLSHELAALLQLLYAPAPSSSSEEATCVRLENCVWAESRLEELASFETPIQLLESLVSLLRTKGAPRWLSTRCSKLLSRTVRRPAPS